MKKLLLALIVAMLPTLALAQSQRNPCYKTTESSSNCISVSVDTPLPVTSAGGASASQIQGNVASGATDSGNPVKVGGVYNTTLPTLTNGQRGDLQTSARSILYVNTVDSSGLGPASFFDATTDGNIASNSGFVGLGFGYNFNGTSWDRQRSIVGATSAGTGTQAVAVAPTSALGAAATNAQSTAAGSNLVIKASAGNLYSLTTTIGATSGYLMLFDAVSLPVDGAVTPIYCLPVSSNGTNGYVAVEFSVPKRFSTGITAGFSTTGCFTLTVSATASFFGGYQ